MAEKLFSNIRLGLKIDTLEKWNSSTLILKKGEVAFATSEVDVTVDNGVAKQPVILAKIGDGSHTFSELKWDFYAKAADVPAWAKAAGIEFVRNDPEGQVIGNVISSIAWEDNKIKYTTATVATSEGLAQLTARVTGAEEAIAALEGDSTTLKEAVETLNGDAQTVGSVAKSVADAIAALDLANTYEAKGEAAKALDDAKAYTDELASGAVATNTAAITAIKDDANIDSFADVVAELAKKQDTGDYATKTEAQGYADAKVASVAAADNSVTIGGTATAPTVGVKVSAAGDNALTLADDGLKVVVPAAAEYTITKDESSADYAAVYRLKKDGVQVGAEINIPKDMVVESGAVVENPVGQVAGTYIELKLQNVTEPLYINVGSLIEYVTSGSQTGDMIVVAVSDDHKVTATITDGTVTKAKLEESVQTSLGKADSAVQSVASGSANGTIAVDGADVAVTGLGSAAYTDAGAYATSEQGSKADSAVQKVTVLGTELTDGGELTVDAAKTALGLGSAAYKDETAFDAAGTGAAAASAVLGTDADTAEANTVYGAKAAIATLNGEGEGSVKKTVADAIAALDVEDTAVADQFVTAVSETDGKIAVSRTTLTLATLGRGDETVEIVFDCGGAGVQNNQ